MSNKTLTIRSLVAVLNSRADCEPYNIDLVCRMLDASGPMNEHLEFPIEEGLREPGGYNRRNPLSPELPIHGELLLLVFENHTPFLRLYEHVNLDDVRIAILHQHCALYESYSDHAVLRNGCLIPFHIQYVNRHGETKVFRRDEMPEPISEDFDIPTYDQVRLIWT